MKISKYIISNYFYDSKNNVGKIIIFSTLRGKIRILEKNIWDKIVQGVYNEITDSDLSDLIESKFLVNNLDNELYKVLKENKDYKSNLSQYYYVIKPSASCQLGCHYCGQTHSSLKLDIEKENLIINRIMNNLLIKKYESLKIGWFGGEPLTGLKNIESISKILLNFCNEKSIIYSAGMTTNGLLLKRDLAYKLFNEFKINNFEITLDGYANYHDERRHTKSNNKTFDVIYKNLVDICKNKPDDLFISVRCNTDSRNKDGILPLLEKIKSDGIEDKISIYFAHLHSWGNDAHKLGAEKKEFASWELNWFTYMLTNNFNFKLIPGRSKNLCMAVNPHSELVDPFGEVFSCTETSLVESYKDQNGKNIYSLGNIKEEIDNNKRKVFSNFYDENEFNKYPCYTCNMLPVCGGGCPKSWKEGIQACPNEKFNMPERLLLYYAYKKMNSQKYNGIAKD